MNQQQSEINNEYLIIPTADIDNPNLEKQMQAEDLYLKPLLQRDNKISWLLLNKKQTEKKLQEATSDLENEQKINKEKDKALGEKDKELKVFKLQLAKSLKNSGKTITEIYSQVNLPIDEIEKL